MPAQWLSNTSDISAKAAGHLTAAAHYLSQPERLRRLRRLLVGILCLWIVLSLAQLLWALLPADTPAGEPVTVINPAVRSEAAAGRKPVDIDALRARHLFGDASLAGLAETPETVAAAPASEREGIEEGARETRLQLTLRGVVSAREDGLGHAIIEYRNKQDVYAVDDELPVSGKVVLAKVMPHQVVLDNNGTYELLTLYDDSELDDQLERAASKPAAKPRQAAPAGSGAVIDKRTDSGVTELASSYRDQLYRNPQSLASVVSISAVREDGQLRGYRIAPGSDAEQFSRLGFKTGDIVTGINGIALDDPSQAMRIYQTMRTASEAVFDLQRGDQPVSVSVSLAPAEG
ncbi:type II secretion system protein GspC [Haliea sp. E17]|uniref:type II secretion system protein GspC n=1 Tax=Haliea sp. E17 TaxID=3401576 RepID=UPI003AAB24AD